MRGSKQRVARCDPGERFSILNKTRVVSAIAEPGPALIVLSSEALTHIRVQYLQIRSRTAFTFDNPNPQATR